jgi:hypothetical protein
MGDRDVRRVAQERHMGVGIWHLGRQRHVLRTSYGISYHVPPHVPVERAQKARRQGRTRRGRPRGQRAASIAWRSSSPSSSLFSLHIFNGLHLISPGVVRLFPYTQELPKQDQSRREARRPARHPRAPTFRADRCQPRARYQAARHQAVRRDQ